MRVMYRVVRLMPDGQVETDSGVLWQDADGDPQDSCRIGLTTWPGRVELSREIFGEATILRSDGRHEFCWLLGSMELSEFEDYRPNFNGTVFSLSAADHTTVDVIHSFHGRYQGEEIEVTVLREALRRREEALRVRAEPWIPYMDREKRKAKSLMRLVFLLVSPC